VILAAPVTEFTISGLSFGAVFALLALGLVLIYRTTGVFNFAHWSIGLLALVSYIVLTNLGLAAPIAAALAIIPGVAAGVLAYRLVLKRVSGAAQVIVILITIGIAGFYASLAAFVLGFEQFTRIEPWLPTANWHIGATAVRSSEIITAASAIVIAFGFLIWFRLSRTGRALRAVAQNREAALLAGIDAVKYSSIAWGIGSTLASLALLLVFPHLAGEQGGLITTFDITPFGTLLIPAFGAALVGGLVHLPMALVGGLVFGLSRELLVLAPDPLDDLRTSIAAILIVVLLLLRTERFFASPQELEALEG
jgi:branched-subunit amino acid ABC-type transport system permease component